MVTGKFNGVGGEPCNGLTSHPGGVELPLVAFCYRNWEKLWSDRPLGWYVCKLVLIYSVSTIIHTVK